MLRTLAHAPSLARLVHAPMLALAAACGGEPAAPAPKTAAAAVAPAGTISIAKATDALTFARYRAGGARRVLLVESYVDGRISGIDVGVALGRDVEDPVGLFVSEGYERLQQIVAAGTQHVDIVAAQLIAPVDLATEHIAAGTNYPEHAADAGVEDGPFLFPKLVEPTGPYDDVAAGDGLLDYEVEAAWVTLEPLREGESPRYMGVILANDYTDRATLLRHLDPWNVASGDGFATGKSFPTYLPVGNLLVIPRDYRTFVRDLELRLTVNGVLRQQSPAHVMVWDFDEILAQTWARRSVTWEHRGSRVALPGASDGVIPARTLILSGTPHGTVFDGVTTRQKLLGATAWLTGGWARPLTSHVMERYIEEARNAGIYLKPGDVVEIAVDRAGVIRNGVVR